MKEYPLSKVADITWCDPEMIAKAARLYATTRPGCIVWGNGTDQLGDNTFQATRALLILMGITGNLDVPGGNCLLSGAASSTIFELWDKLPPEQAAKRLGGDRFKALNLTPYAYAHPPTLYQHDPVGEALSGEGANRRRQQHGDVLPEHRTHHRGDEEARPPGRAGHLHDADRRICRRRVAGAPATWSARSRASICSPRDRGDLCRSRLAQARRDRRAPLGLGIHHRRSAASSASRSISRRSRSSPTTASRRWASPGTT